MKISEKYRIKALECEKRSRDASNYDVKSEWGDVAIEWHTLANRVAEFAGIDSELESRMAPGGSSG